MFVWSLKTSKRQFFSIVACLVVLVAVLITAAVWPSSEEASPTVASGRRLQRRGTPVFFAQLRIRGGGAVRGGQRGADS